MTAVQRRMLAFDLTAVLTRGDLAGLGGGLAQPGTQFSLDELEPFEVTVLDPDASQETPGTGSEIADAPPVAEPGEVFWLGSSDGGTYLLTELKLAPDGTSFFGFIGDVPTPDLTLTVLLALPDQNNLAVPGVEPQPDIASAALAPVAALTGTDDGESLDGTSGDDTIEGLGGDDTITAQGGNDLVDGGLGDDSLDGGPGIDTVSFASAVTPSLVLEGKVTFGATVQLGLQGSAQNTGYGQDILSGFENVEGTEFADLIVGDGAANTLFGGQGGDVLNGGAGADVLYGGPGFDALEGGAGADALYGGDSFGDIATYFSATGPLLFDFGTDLTVLLPTSSAEVADDTFGSDLEGIAGATNFSNTFDASGTNQLTFFLGGRENDTFFGGAGVDQLIGLGGDDVLYGNDSGDAFIGQGGNDTYFGGAGADVFFFDDLDDQDVIGDYEVGEDLIFFTGNNITSLLDLGFSLADGDGDGADDDIVVSYSVLGTTSTITVLNIQDEGDLNIVFSRPNDPPQAEDESFAGVQDTTISGTVTVTDPDAFPLPLSLTVIDQPDNGSVVLNDDGTFTYAPDAGFIGDDSFVYRASDGERSEVATVTLTVSSSDSEAPVVLAALAADTGISSDDTITSDPTIAGTATDDVAVAGLFGQLSTSAGAEFVDISSVLDGSGGFTIDRATLELINGAPLDQGVQTLTLFATDTAGKQSSQQTVAFNLDEEAPELIDVGLAASSDTGLAGDATTSLRSVRLTGESEPGATVTDGTVSTIVGVDGRFTLNGVEVAEGLNQISLTSTDLAGNSTTQIVEITGVAANVQNQPVLLWNDITLEAIADNAEGATGASRILAMQSVAVYDVIAAIDDAPAFLVDATAAEGASLEAAVAQASFLVLSYAFPAFQDDLDAFLAASLANVPDGAGEDAGVALGQAIAERLIAIRDVDGWDDFVTHDAGDQPGEWRETGPLFEPAIDPQWATMDTWALSSQDQFRAVAPPELTSQEYADAVNEVREVGEATSTTRTADQTEAARFWKDGRGTETTPGHWNSIATDLMKVDGTSSADAARALAILNVSVADAMIAAWDTKYTYSLWRPEDAIRLADTDGNVATVAQLDWQPLMLAPAHPEYVSGHAAASGAAAEALTELFGDQTFTTESLGLAGVTRTFDSFAEAAQENADSRLWGGVHFTFANENGLTMGEEVARNALDAFNSQADTGAPVVVVDISLGFTNTLPVAITGAALDSLSGIATLTVTIDDGNAETALEVREVDTDQNGLFSVALDPGTADGTYTFAFQAEDGAGNASNIVTSTAVVDTVDPALDFTNLNAADELEGADARLTGTVDGTGAPIIALAYQIDGGTSFAVSFDPATGAFDSALDLANVGPGAHTVTVLAADAAGNAFTQDIPLTLAEAIPFVVAEVLPAGGSDEVGSTFRPEIHFSRSVDPATVNSDTFFLSDSAGNKLDAQIQVSADGQKAFLFVAAPMPGSTTISLNVTDGVQALDGTPLDGDEDGTDGGPFLSNFTTVSTTAVAGTTLTGFIVDPGDDLKPMTIDDYSAGPDGADYTEDDVFLSPIEGATVFILGLEQFKAVTDENGFFELTNVPAGNVKVAVDGRTATNAPDDYFWPEMVMDANIIAGQVNTLMASMGETEERLAKQGRGEAYLPRVPTEILQEVSDTEETQIGVPVSAAEDLTAEEREVIQLVVQPGTVVDEFGNPVEAPTVGISTVPPELVMDMLPPGVLQHTFDLTIQAPDAAVFTTPASLTLPQRLRRRARDEAQPSVVRPHHRQTGHRGHGHCQR